MHHLSSSHKWGFVTFLLLILCIFPISKIYATCDPLSNIAISIDSVTHLDASCPSKGSITVYVNPASGGGEFVYEIVAGPVLRIPQSQNTLYTLPEGTYTVRVTACNGSAAERQVTIFNTYQTMQGYDPNPSYTIIQGNTLCPSPIDVLISFGLSNMDTTAFSRISQSVSRPLRWQIAASMAGFASAPYNDFDYFSGVEAGGNYAFRDTAHVHVIDTFYIRISDTCDNFVTKSVIVIPPTVETDMFKFQLVKFPQTDGGYIGNGQGSCGYVWGVGIIDSVNNKVFTTSQCPSPYPAYVKDVMTSQWGPWKVSIINALTNDTIIRQVKLDKSQVTTDATGSVVTGHCWPSFFGPRPFGWNDTNRVPFDVPIRMLVENTCGYQKLYDYPAQPTPVFNITHEESCSTSPIFTNIYVDNSYQYPVTFFRLDTLTNMPVDSFVRDHGFFHTDYVIEAPDVAPGMTMKIAAVNACGQTDTITYVANFGPGISNIAEPTFDFTITKMANCEPRRFRVEMTHNNLLVTNILKPLHYDSISGQNATGYVWITSGPAESGPYPIITDWSTGNNLYITDTLSPGGGLYPAVIRPHRLTAGTYTMAYAWGCGQVSDTTFTITDDNINLPYTFDVDYSVLNIPCYGNILQRSVSKTGAVPASFYFVVESGPQQYLDSISTVLRNYMAQARAQGNTIELLEGDSVFSYPIIGDTISGLDAGTKTSNFHWVIANTSPAGKHDTITLDVNLYQDGLFYGFHNNPFLITGDYVVSWYASDTSDCSGPYILADRDTIHFTNTFIPDVSLATTSAIVCQNSDKKIIFSPSGGTPGYTYEYRLDIPDEPWTVAPTNEVMLPPATPIGTIYQLRVTDQCGRSYTGYSSLAAFTGNFYLAPDSFCVGASSGKLTTMNLPYTTYTWAHNGTIIPGANTNEFVMSPVTLADTGTYYLYIDFMNECLVDTTQFVLDPITNCDFIALPLGKLIFNVYAKNCKSLIEWTAYDEMNINKYLLQRKDTKSGSDFETIAEVKAYNAHQYTYDYFDINAETDKTYQYRLKVVDTDGLVSYSTTQNIQLNCDADQLLIYPNPVDNELNVFIYEDTDEVALSIIDVSGKIISKTQYTPLTKSQLYKLNTSHLAAGMYSISVKTGNLVRLIKFVKQ